MQALIRQVLTCWLWTMAFFLALCGLASAEMDWFERGLLELNRSRHEEAIESFSKAIEKDPDNQQAYNNRGIARCQKGEYDHAIADYTKALEIAGRSAEVYNNRGVAWFHKYEYDLAIEDYNRALETDPGFFKAYNNRGAAWFCKGEKALAVSDYKMALEFDPDSIETRRQLDWIMKANDEDGNPGYANPSDEQGTGFCVQAGAFLSMKNAERLSDKLTGKGYAAHVVAFKGKSNKTWYTVLIGNYVSREEALKEANAFSVKEQMPVVVRTPGKL
jgi:tetratricopeptide (TPR) repeat protein